MPRFAATTKAFEKGVESIAPDAAIKLIDDWEGQLKDLDTKDGKTITRDLEALKKELAKGEKMDGEKVQKLTAKLGAETVKAATGIEGGGGDKVKALGEALSKAAG